MVLLCWCLLCFVVVDCGDVRLVICFAMWICVIWFGVLGWVCFGCLGCCVTRALLDGLWFCGFVLRG